MILVTGGAGYIGSHTVVQLIAAGHDLLILDAGLKAVGESVAQPTTLFRQ